MSNPILKYCFSAVLLVMASSLYGQQQVQEEAPSDTVADAPKQRVPLKSYIPTGLRIGTDLITDIVANRSATISGWEANADIDFYRYYLTMEYGRWAHISSIKNGQYDNNGHYWKLGVDVNFLKKDPDKNMFFLGARVGRAYFTDSISYVVTIPTFGDYQKTAVNNDLVGSWFELTTGLRVKIWKYFWMGYTGRLKLGHRVHREKEFKSLEIPGYGLTSVKNYWGFSYQLYFRIPLRKQQ